MARGEPTPVLSRSGVPNGESLEFGGAEVVRDGRVQALIPPEVGAVGGSPSGGSSSPSSGIRGRAVVGGRGTAHEELVSQGMFGGMGSDEFGGSGLHRERSESGPRVSQRSDQSTGSG